MQLLCSVKYTSKIENMLSQLAAYFMLIKLFNGKDVPS